MEAIKAEAFPGIFYNKGPHFDIYEVDGCKFALFHNGPITGATVKIDNPECTVILLNDVTAEGDIHIKAFHLVALASIRSLNGDDYIRLKGFQFKAHPDINIARDKLENVVLAIRGAIILAKATGSTEALKTALCMMHSSIHPHRFLSVQDCIGYYKS